MAVGGIGSVKNYFSDDKNKKLTQQASVEKGKDIKSQPDSLSLSTHYKKTLGDVVRFDKSNGKSVQLNNNEGNNIKHMLEIFVKDPEEVMPGVYPEVLLHKPESLYRSIQVLGKSSLFSMSADEFERQRAAANTPALKERLCKKLIKSVTDFDAFSNTLCNDMNYTLYSRLFSKDASIKEMDAFNMDLKAEFDKERDYRMMAWKDDIQYSYGLQSLADNNDVENLAEPNKFQQANLDTLTYDKLAEYIFPALLGHFCPEKEVLIGTDYCDSKGNDIYAWDKTTPTKVTAYDLTTASGEFLNKKIENNRKYAHKNREAAGNFLTIMEAAEGLDPDKIQIEKKITTLDGPLWKEFMWGVLQLVLKNQFYTPGTNVLNEEAVNNAYKAAMKDVKQISGVQVPPLNQYLDQTLSGSLNPRAENLSFAS